MAWWNRKRDKPEEPPAQTAALTAAATAVRAHRAIVSPAYDTWQEEVWDHYDSLGEFRYAIDWKSEMVSRVRLRAARTVPGQDEPEVTDEGIPAQLIMELGGGVGGQSEMLASLSTQINVPGEGYLVGESFNGANVWSVRSADEIRVRNKQYEVIDDEKSVRRLYWRPLPEDSLVVRIWKPHRRYRYLADSPARSMRSTMRELELVNRKIQAQYLSRLASAGVFVIADEISFPVREEFAEAEDPFVEEWIETAREAIKEPGAASAVVPIPMRVPGEYVDKMKFIDFSIAEDEKIIEKRESAIRRLATQVDVPAEILLGMGDVNHWSAWQLEESAIKTHISSDIETIVNALTIGYLHPRLKALGEDPNGWVVWYDTSELTQRPDKSANALQAYDHLELSGSALRRELGFDESDAPTAQELRSSILRKLAANPQSGMIALAELINDPELSRALDPDGDDQAGQPDDAEDTEDRGLPDTQGEPPPEPDADLVIQASAMHRITFELNRWTLRHPRCCDGRTMGCPVAQASRYLSYHPGTLGDYECWLSPRGDLVVGKQAFDRQDEFIEGHSRRFGHKALVNGSR